MPTLRPARRHASMMAALALAGAQALAATPTSDGAESQAAPASPPLFTSASLGVELYGARLSASGYVIDLRYRVIDGEKARPLMDRKLHPVLVDEATGNRYYVPQPPLVGALRQTTRNHVMPTVGKTYFMLFANPDRRLKAGDAVVLYLGDERFGQLKITP